VATIDAVKGRGFKMAANCDL